MNTIRRNVTAFALVLTLGTAGAAVVRIAVRVRQLVERQRQRFSARRRRGVRQRYRIADRHADARARHVLG